MDIFLVYEKQNKIAIIITVFASIFFLLTIKCVQVEAKNDEINYYYGEIVIGINTSFLVLNTAVFSSISIHHKYNF